MTRFCGVSNIIEMQDNVVTTIITQSRYVTSPSSLLKNANDKPSTDSSPSWSHFDNHLQTCKCRKQSPTDMSSTILGLGLFDCMVLKRNRSYCAGQSEREISQGGWGWQTRSNAYIPVTWTVFKWYRAFRVTPRKCTEQTRCLYAMQNLMCSSLQNNLLLTNPTNN